MKRAKEPTLWIVDGFIPCGPAIRIQVTPEDSNGNDAPGLIGAMDLLLPPVGSAILKETPVREVD